MSLRVQLHDKSAKLPRENTDGTYDIYSLDEKTIPAGMTLSIATGISIAPPIGFSAFISSCELAANHNIETSSYNSCNNMEYKFSNGEKNVVPLILYLRNYSRLPYQIKSGDCIGKMQLVRTRMFQIERVDDINAGDDENKTAVNALPFIKTMAKSAMLWFKQSYKSNPTDTINRYMTNDDYQILLKIIHDSDEYKIARRKLEVETNCVWSSLSASIKNSIRADFDALNHKPASAPAPAPPLGRLSRSEESESEEEII